MFQSIERNEEKNPHRLLFRKLLAVVACTVCLQKRKIETQQIIFKRLIFSAIKGSRELRNRDVVAFKAPVANCFVLFPYVLVYQSQVNDLCAQMPVIMAGSSSRGATCRDR